jgi:hypothetical protein
VFFLPERHTQFNFVDDEVTRGERFASVPSTDADPDCDVADAQRTHPVHTQRYRNAKALDSLGENALALLDGQAFARFVLESFDSPAFAVIANSTFEYHYATAARLVQRAAQRSCIERMFGKAKLSVQVSLPPLEE